MELDDTMDDQMNTTQEGHLPGISKRRANKHLIERRRRARINSSLTQLKTLVLEGMRKDPTRFNRLEKADILEMTVTHLRTLRNRQVAASSATDPDFMSRYKAGFSECASEICRFLSSISDLDEALRSNISDHLTMVVQRAEQTAGRATSPSGHQQHQNGAPLMSHRAMDTGPLDLSKHSTVDSDSSLDSQENIAPDMQFPRVPHAHAPAHDSLPLGQMQITGNAGHRMKYEDKGRTSPDAVSECSVSQGPYSDHIDSGVDDVDSLNEYEPVPDNVPRKNELLHDAHADGSFPDESMWRPW